MHAAAAGDVEIFKPALDGGLATDRCAADDGAVFTKCSVQLDAGITQRFARRYHRKLCETVEIRFTARLEVFLRMESAHLCRVEELHRNVRNIHGFDRPDARTAFAQ